MWLPLRAPYGEPGPQSRHVPWLEIQPETQWFTGQCSIHSAIPGRANFHFSNHMYSKFFLFMGIWLTLHIFIPCLAFSIIPILKEIKFHFISFLLPQDNFYGFILLVIFMSSSKLVSPLNSMKLLFITLVGNTIICWN